MTQVFLLPDLGEGLTEAEVVEWLVAEGDEVTVDQPVVVVETAKATVDVPCPYAGTVTTCHGAVGEMLEVGKPLITVGGGTPLAGHEQYREEEQAGATKPADDEASGAVLIGYGTGSGGARRRRRRTGGRPAAPTATPAPPPEPSEPTPALTQQTTNRPAPRVISPIVRRLATEHGIDLGTLPAVARGDVIRRADVEEAIQQHSPSTASDPAPSAAMTASSPVEAPGEDVERLPLTGLRKVIADKLSRSRTEIPDATTWVDVDATGLMAAKDALKRAYPDAGIGVLPLLARVCVQALQDFPELNATVDTQAQEVLCHRRVHLGFAAQSPRGLVVPVVRDAHELSTRQLAEALRELTRKARDGELSPAELTGGTFTLNNYGVFGVDGSTPILNHPEAAMIGVGRIIDRPWAHEGQLTLRKVTQVGLTFDHRVCDGGSAGGFLRRVADLVETPLALLAAV